MTHPKSRPQSKFPLGPTMAKCSTQCFIELLYWILMTSEDGQTGPTTKVQKYIVCLKNLKKCFEQSQRRGKTLSWHIASKTLINNMDFEINIWGMP